MSESRPRQPAEPVGPVSLVGAGPRRFGTVVVVGASARAIGASAVRAGFEPYAIDLFADRDLAALAPARRVDRGDFPANLEAAVAEAPPGPWLYTGPLENHPELIDRIARVRPLWGIRGASLRAVRDPFRVRDVLQRAGLACPEVRERPDGLPRDGSWLVKPLRSGGGIGIRTWRDAGKVPNEEVVYQRRIVGPSFAALFLAGPGRCAWLGSTAQRLGRLGDPFAYAGSVGPVAVATELRTTLRRMGEVLRSAFALRGLFGIDYVLHDGVPWPVEINPRYTASAEVLERAKGRLYLGWHAAVFGAPRPGPSLPRLSGVVGKAILFAERECRFPAGLVWQAGKRTPFDWSALADIPHPGEAFAPGDPIVTVFARGANQQACELALDRAISRWRRRLERVAHTGVVPG